MPIEIQAILWGLAAAVPALLNLGTNRSPDAIGLATMVFLTWVVGRVFWAFYSPPEAMQWYPVIDMMAGITALMSWQRRPAVWKGALVALFMGQLCLHAAFWMAWPAEGSLYRYILFNNLFFAAQLVCVGSPGVGHVAALAVSRVSRGARTGHHARV